MAETEPTELPEIVVEPDDSPVTPASDSSTVVASEGPWSKYAPGADKTPKPWEKYSAQGDPDVSGSLGRGLQRKARGGASEFQLGDLYGRETDKYDYSGAPLGMQMDVSAAANPEEIRLALGKYVADKPEDVGQDQRGRWWVNINGKKTIVEPNMLANLLSSAPTTMGAGAGTAVGAAIGTAVMPGVGTAAGAVAGGGIGGMIGQGLEDVHKAVKGNYATPASEEIERLGWAGLENAAFSAIAPVARGAKELSRSAYRSMVGVTRHQAAVDRAVRIWGDSGGEVIPPAQSFAPEATRMVRAEQNRNLISYGGLSPENAKRIEYMKNRFQRVLQSSGMPPAEIDSAINDVISGKSATSGTSAGAGIVDMAQRTVRQAEQTIAADVDAARNALRNEEAAYRQFADSSGRVGADVEAWVEQERAAFYGHFDAAYSNVNRLAGNSRVVDLTAASAAAERLMQIVEPGNVPPLVARVAGLRQEAATLRRQAAASRANGDTAGATRLDTQADMLLNRTVEEAQGLRTLLRDGMRAQTKGGGPVGPSYHFLSAIEDAVDTEFTNLSRIGNGLSSEAARELARVDRAYRDGISFYKNQTIKKITRDAQDGTFAAPEVIARNILNPNELEAARNMFGRMPPALQQQVLAADLRGKLFRSSEQDSVTGQWGVRGKDFLREWQKSRGIHEFYPPAFRQNLERWASELAAVDGHLELTALQNPSQVTQLLQNAANEERALNDFVRNDPVGALASGEPHMIDKAVKEIAKPGEERSTERALNRIGRGTPEWQRVTHWAMIDLFEGAIRKTPAGETEILGKDVLNKLNSYTKKQQDMLFPGSLADDIRTLGEDVFALFPRGGDIAMGLSAGTVTNTSVFNLRQVWKQMRFYTLGKIADSQAYLALVADLKRNHPQWDSIKTGLGQMGRAVFNAEEKPPQEKSQGGNQIPRFAQGGIVTKPTVAMVGEKGPEAIVPLAKQQGQNLLSGLEGQIGAAKQHQQSVLTGLENKFGGMEHGFLGWLEGLLQQSPQGQQLLQNLQQRGIPGFAEGGVVTEPTIATLGEKGPEAVVPLTPQQPTNFLADASPQDQAMQAREVAAQRMQRGVQPGGMDRSQWPPSPQMQAGAESFLDIAAPGYSAVKAAGRGEYGEAAMEAGMAAAPFGAGKIAGALSSPIGKAVAASTAALYAMFTDTATGKSNLSPEAQEKLRFLQEKSKLEQKQRTEEAVRRKQEADDKAARDVQAAQQAAQTQADLQARLAQIEAEKQKEQARIKLEAEAAERHAAEETVRRNAEENKRQLERPFALRHPDAALGATLGGIAVAALIPGGSEAFKRWAFNSYAKEFAKLDETAAKVLLTGTPAEQQLAVNRLTAAAAQQAEREGKLHKFPWLTQISAPGIAIEGSLIPHEIDRAQAPGTEARKSADEFFSTPSEWGAQAALGLGGGLAGLTAKEGVGAFYKTKPAPSAWEGNIKTFEEKQATRKAENEAALKELEALKKKRSEAAEKGKATKAKKKAEAEAEKEPRKAKVPREGTKIYGLREE